MAFYNDTEILGMGANVIGEGAEKLKTYEFNNISAYNAIVEGVKVSGGLFVCNNGYTLIIGSEDTNYNSQIRNLVLNDGKSLITIPKGRYQISYDYLVKSNEFKQYENASVLLGVCPRASWKSDSWVNSYNNNLAIEGFSVIAPDIYNGIRYETRHEQMGIYDSESDLADFSCYKLDTLYSVKDVFEVTEDDSIIVISAMNMTNWVEIRNIVVSEISQKVTDRLAYSEVNKSPNSQAIWEGMSGFVNDTVSRTQQHSHMEVKALANLFATTDKQVFEWDHMRNLNTLDAIDGVPVASKSLYSSRSTDAAGSFIVLSPDRNTYIGEPKTLLLYDYDYDKQKQVLLKLPKGVYLVKYKWRQSGRTPQTFIHFDEYCNRMPYVKFVNQLDNQSTWTPVTGIDISGNILKYRGNYWANQWYEDSYIFTIDDSNYGGYFGIKAAYLQCDIHITNVNIYTLTAL